MILLDTHAWWWAISEPANLSVLAAEAIAKTPEGQIGVASVSLWEFVMMVQRGRIHLKISPKEWFSHAINRVMLFAGKLS